jgi:hypothetical protein
MKELREDRRPADLWFWSDWLASVDVRSCSLAAQGLWINMLAIMSRSDRKGFLSINGKPMDSKELAKFVGVFKDEVETLLVELEYYNVFSRDVDGTIYNRRMKNLSDLSRKRSEAGRLGGLKQNASKDEAGRTSKAQATLESDNEDASFLTLKEEALNLWNGLAVSRDLPAIKSIPAGSKRERALRARASDKSFDFRALLTAVEASPFLLGKKTDFKATFDWIIAPSNYQKIIEGNYRGTTPIDGPAAWLKEQEAKDADK